MFGYVNINKQELKVKDYETYHAYYCGLCQMLKHRYGSKGQVLLSFDLTFLIVLLSGHYELRDREYAHRCMLHPFYRQPVRVNSATAYAADMSILLAYENFRDNWLDDKSVAGITAAAVLNKDYKEVAQQYPRQAKALQEYIKKLHQIEAEMDTSIDKAAGATGELLGEIFIYKEDMWREDFRRIGFFLGKFIYLMDAFEDMEKDEKKGLYNPFLLQEKTGAEEEKIKETLKSMISECSRAFERLPVLRHTDILRNILYSGVWSKYEMIQVKRADKNKEDEGAGK